MSDIVTLDGARMALPPDAVDELRAQVRGAVLEPGDSGPSGSARSSMRCIRAVPE
jgi:hypothetical protein